MLRATKQPALTESARPGMLLLLLLLALMLAVFAGQAYADPFGAQSFDGAVTADETGDVSYTQAGGHPYAVSTSITFNVDPDPVYGPLWPAEPVKDILVDVPPGLIGNPTVAAECSLDQLVGPSPRCPPAAQVGVVTLSTTACPEVCIPIEFLIPGKFVDQPVYRMVTPPNVPARFAFIISGSVVSLDAEVRSASDYGLSVNVRNAAEALPINGTTVTFWGTPADPRHTAQRWCPDGGPGGPRCEAGVAPQAMFTMPSSCAGPQTTNVRLDSWEHPGVFTTASFVSHRTAAEGGAPQGVTGCDLVPFDAAFTAKPDTTASPGPSGWTFDLSVPQDDIANPDTIAQSTLRTASVTLPAGVRMSPSAADGLGACTPAQIALSSEAAPTCPDASKVGTLTIDTPLLDDPLTGGIYLAKPRDNPFNSLVAIYLVAEGKGVTLKLPGSVAPDPATGQLTATVADNPQLPFSRVHLHFFGGARAALSNPPRCGTYTTKAVLTSWSGKTVQSDSQFTTSHDGQGAPCPAPQFKPTLSAGTTTADGHTPAGGSFSTFQLRVSRSDDDEEFAALQSVDMPDGLLAKLAGVPLCAPADVAKGTCSEASRIGSVTTAAGPGPNPFAVSGRLYLGGPYKGAPFSLSIVVPAIAGPFDLGTIVVRAAIFVDPATAKLKVETDPIPTILEGIPLQVRRIGVTIDRPGFIINPTSCAAKTIGATALSTAGTRASMSSRFKVEFCGSRPLHPKLAITVGAKGRTRPGVSTPLVTKLTQTPGQTNLKSVSVTLPLTLNALLPVVNNACTQAEFDAGNCEKARTGSAEAVTPLLDKPLAGSVYFVKTPVKGALPNLVVALRGQVAFNLVGKIKIPDSGVLGTRFETVPDVPIKSFTLKLGAGKHGALGTVANLCSAESRRQVAAVSFRGQNGKLVQVGQRLKVRGCPSRKGHRARH